MNEPVGTAIPRIVAIPDEGLGNRAYLVDLFCSSSAAGEPWTTIGREREADRLFFLDEDEFVRTFLGGLGSYPHYFLRLREVNRRGPRLQGANWPPLPAKLMAPLTLAPLDRMRTAPEPSIDGSLTVPLASTVADPPTATVGPEALPPELTWSAPPLT